MQAEGGGSAPKKVPNLMATDTHVLWAENKRSATGARDPASDTARRMKTEPMWRPKL